MYGGMANDKINEYLKKLEPQNLQNEIRYDGITPRKKVRKITKIRIISEFFVKFNKTEISNELSFIKVSVSEFNIEKSGVIANAEIRRTLIKKNKFLLIYFLIDIKSIPTLFKHNAK